MNTLLLYPIAIPILFGLVCLLTPRQLKGPREALTVLTALASAALSIFIFIQPTQYIHIPWLTLSPKLALAFDFQSMAYARLTLLVISIFGLLAALYSIPVLAKRPRHNEYYAYFLMALGAFVKIGVMPLHSWITAISTEAPMTVMGFFTSLDKMPGFYLLTVLTLRIFDLSAWAGWFLMTMGAVTLLGGVLMAMVQSDYRKMLAFHSVSQIGYMVLGIGTGTPIGIIGGLFHWVNMVIVKGALYLCGGSVQYATGKTKFSEMGGLAKAMPWTFASTLIASLAIAGVPPLNAFVSKWLVYQGIIERGGNAFSIKMTHRRGMPRRCVF